MKWMSGLVLVLLWVTTVAAYGFDLGGFVREVSKRSEQVLQEAQKNANSNNAGKGTKQASKDGLVTSTALLQHYQQSTTDLLKAQAEFLRAFDLKQAAAALDAEATALGGTSLGTAGLKKITVRSMQANEAIQQKINERTQLTEQGRKHYVQGLVPYLTGCRELTIVHKKIHYIEEDFKSGNVDIAMRSIEISLFMAQNLFPYLNSLKKTSASVMSYAKSNKVDVPKDATSVFDDL